jgi:outer membrane protein assembly factor BamB
METTSTDPAAHGCDHCGAPLPPADDSGTRQCTFCKTVYRVPVPKAPSTPPPQTIVYTPPEFEPVNASSTNRGCGLGGLIVLVIIVAAIGIPIWAIAREGGFDSLTSTPLSFADVNPVLLPGEPSGPVSFVTLASRYDSGRSASVYSLVRSDGVSEHPIWSTELDGQASGERTILTDGTSAFVAVERTVTAVSVATGAITWKATLTDEVRFNVCEGCFQLHAGALVVLTADGNVQALDPTSGAARWSRRLDGTTTVAYDTGPHVVVFDGTGGDYVLITLDPATGTEVARFTPACTDPGNVDWTTELSTSSALLASSTPDRLWFMDGSSPTCIQQYDVTTGTMVSEAIADDESGSISSSPVLLETPLGLVITSYRTLGLVDPTGTTYHQVVTSEDIELSAVGATSSAIIVNTTNRRGTATTSVRAIDPNSGATFWDAPMGTAVAVETEDLPPNQFAASSMSQGGTYVAHLDGASVRVLTMREFDDNSQQLVLDSFDATTGTAQPSVTVSGDSVDIIPYLGPGTWTGSRLVTGAGDDQVVLVDFSTMSVPYRLT